MIWCCISVKFQFEMVVLKVLREFAGGTTIHGFTFLVSPKSSSRTKIIWALLLVVAFMYATLEMRNSVVGKYDYIFKTRNLTSDYHCICKNSLVERSIFHIFWKPQYIFSSRNQNCCNISPWASNKENLEYVVQYQKVICNLKIFSAISIFFGICPNLFWNCKRKKCVFNRWNHSLF